MARGSSNLATRSCRNLRMRSETDLSSFSSSRRAAGSNSICQAMLPHDFFERDRLHAAGLDLFHSLLGQINVFQVFKILKDGLTSVVGLSAPSAFGEPGKAFFDAFGEADSQHDA